MTVRLEGKIVADAIRQRVRRAVEQCQQDSGLKPGLAVVLVGDDPASEIYVRQKHKAATSVGIESYQHHLNAEVTTEAVCETVAALNRDPKVHGILVQLPLPPHIDRDQVLQAIAVEKDVDGLTRASQGALMQNRPGLRPCTPLGIIDLLAFYHIPIAGQRAVIVGRSSLVGLPVALMLQQQDATITIVHSRTVQAQAVTATADILVVAAGQPRLVTRSWVKEGAVVVDVGIHRTSQGLIGDVATKELEGYAAAVTPVPGGVGPMTIAELMHNTWQAFDGGGSD
ncbi:MAG: bifunctional methylenetetrahydrofolate dehydrogenase/methenyltetrahydrofolate cyclohydrolase FolD [Sulfobacillus acidophilus]|uniref:Bifunctional protein FolD n=1 Tax=Sulfobacillus acidophilus TaxID=53633 RepID=A0A2T2WPJ7_9FIRM|nr:MAG: bifunctional methylenetetrahydrofolate dehydrogenase/methenyltetrahydrofolate cyclohydrolase FolD [Sulfobacillus acidophilus]